METLISVAFDNLSSRDSIKIRKGIRQIESLLAQICLSKPTSVSPTKRRASAMPSSRSSHQQQQSHVAAKSLEALPEDLAFREFFRLQDGFEWNVASRLIEALERLLGMGANGENDLLIVSSLDLLQGALLLHPPSRRLFGRENYMNLLLDLLDVYNPPAIQSSTLLVLVTSLLSQPHNIRAFEAVDGLLTVTSLFKSTETAQKVKTQIIEFLYFYLMPEVPDMREDGEDTTIIKSVPDGCRTTEEKERMLGYFLSNIDGLVQDLQEAKVAGASSLDLRA